jgi:hypothetical protein
MATTAEQLDQIVASTLDKWRPKLVDMTVKRSSVLAALEMRSRIIEKGGKSLKIPFRYALNDTVKSYEGYDLFDTTPQGGFGHAVFDWRQVVGTVTIDGKTLRVNSGPEAMLDLMEEKMTQLEDSFARKFNEYLFALTPGAKDPLSLPVLVDDTGTLGGVDSSTETWWKSVVVPGPVDLTTMAGVRTLSNVENTLSVNGATARKFHFTTQANYEAYEALNPPLIRYEGERVADLGFKSLAYKDSEIIFDPFVPQPGGSGGGYWYIITPESLEFRVHPDANFEKLDTQRPYNQDAYNTPVIWMGNLAINNRRVNGVIKSTTV